MLSLQSDSPSSGVTNLMSGLSNCSGDHVTGPRLAGHDVPGGEVLDVVVAGERADLAVEPTTCSQRARWRWPTRSSVNFSGSAPTTLSMKPIVSRISVSSVTRPLRSGRVEQLGEALDLAGLRRRCRRCRSARSATARGTSQSRVPRRAAAARSGSRARFGTLAGVQRLDPAEADHPGRHPVGQHDHVALDRLAGAELVLHLGVELGVVVDVVGVVDRDARSAPRRPAGRGRLAASGRCRPASWR